MGVFDQKNNKMLKAHMPVMIGTYSALSIGTELAALGAAAPASAVITSGIPHFVPVTIPAPATVMKLWCVNGATVNGNVDMGIYDEAGNLLVAKGTTAQSGTNTVQEFNITDTQLQPGRYYLALATDSATATFMQTSVTLGSAAFLKALGVAQWSLGTFPLTTGASINVGGVVIAIGLSIRSAVVT